MMKKKIIISLSMFLLLVLLFPTSDTAYADTSNIMEGTENASKLKNNDNEVFYYHLETDMHSEDEASSIQFMQKMQEKGHMLIMDIVMFVNNWLLNANINITKFILATLSFAQEFDFFDEIIDKTSNEVEKIVGVSGTSFQSNSFFGNLTKIIALIVILYAFYQFIWKRSVISSLGEMFKFVVVLTTALLIFANYSAFLTGVNNVSAEIGKLIVSDRAVENTNSRLDAYNETIWFSFVDRPYLLMQYGTDDVNSIGRNRIRELLTTHPFSADRSDIVTTEIEERDNVHMTYSNVLTRSTFTVIYMGFNLFTSIPILLISLSIIFTQFWFLAIAIIAPFALLIASFPTQFGVLRRYFFELSLPLMIKIGLHFVLFFIMVLSGIILNIDFNTRQTGLLEGHLSTMLIQALMNFFLFVTFFLLRKRIIGILSSGTEKMKEIRESMRNVSPAKHAVQKTATAIGTGVGAMGGGIIGASAGAGVGNAIGKTLTGEGGMANVADSLNRNYRTNALHAMKNKNTQRNMEQKNDRSNVSSNSNEMPHSVTPNVSLSDHKQALETHSQVGATSMDQHNTIESDHDLTAINHLNEDPSQGDQTHVTHTLNEQGVSVHQNSSVEADLFNEPLEDHFEQDEPSKLHTLKESFPSDTAKDPTVSNNNPKSNELNKPSMVENSPNTSSTFIEKDNSKLNEHDNRSFHQSEKVSLKENSENEQLLESERKE